MRAKPARANGPPSAAQVSPQPVTVDNDTALVQNAIEQQRRRGLYTVQPGNVDSSTRDATQPSRQSKNYSLVFAGKRDQQVKVRVGITLAPRKRTVEHRKADLPLGAKRPADPRDQVPMTAQVIALPGVEH
jgi:hypothetical protein